MTTRQEPTRTIYATTPDRAQHLTIPLDDIRVVLPAGDGLLNIVYEHELALPHRKGEAILVRETRAAVADLFQLLITLGWAPGLDRNEHLTSVVPLPTEVAA